MKQNEKFISDNEVKRKRGENNKQQQQDNLSAGQGI